MLSLVFDTLFCSAGSETLDNTADSEESEENGEHELLSQEDVVLEAAQIQLFAMYETSDRRSELSARIMHTWKHDPHKLLMTLRVGWKESLSQHRDSANMMVLLAGLILSIAFPLSTTKLEGEDIEDIWTPYRDAAADVFLLLTMGASLCALMSVVFALMFVLSSEKFIQDADDFLWYIATFNRRALVDLPTFLSVLQVVLAIAVASIILFPHPMATACAFFVVGTAVIASIVCIRFTIKGKARMSQSYEEIQSDYTRLIERTIYTLEKIGNRAKDRLYQAELLLTGHLFDLQIFNEVYNIVESYGAERKLLDLKIGKTVKDVSTAKILLGTSTDEDLSNLTNEIIGKIRPRADFHVSRIFREQTLASLPE